MKPQNVLFTGTDTNEIKIIDFGLSAFIGKRRRESFVGTPAYIAPEALVGTHGKEFDVWSLGVLLYNMLSACMPFDGASTAELYDDIRRGLFNIVDGPWKCVSDSAKQLICGMLVNDPRDRLTIQDVVKHRWFSGLHGMLSDQDFLHE